MIYHLLPETETFSEHGGGAQSRWVANVLRADAGAKIVCARADSTWQFPADRIIRVSGLAQYGDALRSSRGRMPWSLRLAMCRALFTSFAARLRAGDVVYIHNRPELVAILRDVLGPGKIRIVLHLHNSHLVNNPRGLVRRARADAIVFCSAALEREAQAIFADLPPTAVIPNGADPQLFRPSSDTLANLWAPIVLFVGRLVPEKGAHVLVAALAILSERGIAVCGRIVGSADFGRSRQTRYTRELQSSAGANVTFVDYRTGAALAQEFRQAAIFCCPSVWDEPFGMVNVEAMASALPVVASAVGGIPEIFAAGGALLVPPDSPASLADALERLVRDPALRRQLAAEGNAAFRDRFTWEIVRERYLRLIRDLPTSG